MRRIYSIYKSTNKINGKVYIGFDSFWPRRKWEHNGTAFKESHRAFNNHFHNAIRKYGKDAFEWDIIYQSSDRDYTLKTMEPFFIEEYNSHSKELGYNMTIGGDGRVGPMSEEGKRNISIASKNRPPVSLETRRKMSESHQDISGKNNPMYGRKDAWDHVKNRKLECPKCGKISSLGNSKRWHFDNCRII